MAESDANLARLRESWTANAGAWTDAVRGGRIPSRRAGTDDAIRRAVADAVPGGGRVLDAGCGEGWLVRALDATGYRARGVDGSAPLIERAREAGGDFAVLSYEEAVANPPRLGGPYDAVVLNFALFGDDPAVTELLAALRSSLAPNGRMLIQTLHPFAAAGDGPYRDGWREETFDTFGGAFPSAMPWYFRTVGSWLAVVRAAGLDPVECREPVNAAGRPLSLLLVCG